MLNNQLAQHTGCVAILISEEAKDYRPEMTWLAARLRAIGLDAYCVEPRHIRFTEEGLRITSEGMDQPIALIYRFYELFDLLNIPKSELVQYAIKKGRVAVTPPYKPALEEKLAFALLHHPVLRPFWEQALGRDVFLHLSRHHAAYLDSRSCADPSICDDSGVGDRRASRDELARSGHGNSERTALRHQAIGIF